MIELNLSEKDLSNKLNISEKKLRDWLSYKQTPNTKEVKEILKVLDIKAKPYKKVWLLKEKSDFEY